MYVYACSSVYVCTCICSICTDIRLETVFCKCIHVACVLYIIPSTCIPNIHHTHIYYIYIYIHTSLPSELRLLHYSEEEAKATHQSDHILQQHSEYIAKCSHTKYVVIKAIKQWVKYKNDSIRFKIHIGQKLFK